MYFQRLMKCSAVLLFIANSSETLLASGWIEGERGVGCSSLNSYSSPRALPTDPKIQFEHAQTLTKKVTTQVGKEKSV